MGRSKKPLTHKQVDAKLAQLSAWQPNKRHTVLTKTFEFPSFVAALAFVAKITVHAEVLDHHPEIELSYGKVKVKLTTHSLKGLSQNDFELAKRVDRLRVG